MKHAVVGIILLFLAACGGIQASDAMEPTAPSLTATRTAAPFSVVSNTPTTFATATNTTIAITETPGPPTGTAIPSPTPRINLPPLKPGTSILLTSTQMFDPQNGWGFDSEYHILRTHDGGKTWQDVTPPTGYYDRKGFFALDADKAWATSSVGLYLNPVTSNVWRTDDGGQNWESSEEFRLDVDQYAEPYSSEFYLPQGMQFINRQTGWLLAAVSYNMNATLSLFFQTGDGGETWQTINSRIEFPGNCLGVGFVFIDSQTGWAGGNCFFQEIVSNKISVFVLPNGWGIYKTIDSGRSYEQQSFMPIPEEFQQLDLLDKDGNCGEIRFESFAEDVIGIEWGCSIFEARQPDYKYFALSADGGKTWTSWKSSGNEFFLDAQHGWRLLSPGELQQTIDGGLNWVTIKIVTWDNAEFDFVNDQEGWAIASVGQARVLLQTVNGGQTWAELHPRIGP